jgi:hypothetical protein
MNAKPMPRFHLVLSEAYTGYSISNVFFFIIVIFYPLGNLISPHLFRCIPLVVDDHNFKGRRLTSAATSNREQYKLIS